MKRRCVKKCTMHDSMPWSDESWYYDDDFYSDGYHEDMPAFLKKAGQAIGLVKKTPLEKATGAVKSVGKSISKKAKSVGKWVKNNPVKTAAAIGAGVGAGTAAHQIVKGIGDSLYLDLMSPNEVARFALRSARLGAKAEKTAKAGLSTLREQASNRMKKVGAKAASMAKHEAAAAARSGALKAMNKAANPSILSRAGGAIKGAASKAGSAIKGAASKAGNAIKEAFGSHASNTASKVGKVGKAASSAAKESTSGGGMLQKAGEWVKNNPGKTAAIAGGAGLAAGAAAHKIASSRDSMFGITSYDSLPWVNGRRRDSALKRYIDRRVRQIISRLNDLGPGEFDPSIPLYNNRLPQARNMGAYHGPRELEAQFSKKQNEPMSGSLKSQIIQGIGETSDLVSRNLAKFIEPKDSQALMNEITNLKKYLLSPDTPDKRMANNIIAKLRVYLVELKKRFWEESPSWNGRFNPQLATEWKQQVNAVLKKIDKLQDLLTSIGLR